ncbi:hypothetical protein CR513_30804, partial [Mucuna pruriens]
MNDNEFVKDFSSMLMDVEKLKVLQENEKFYLVFITKKPTMLKKIVGTKINLFFIVIFAINLVTIKSIAKSRKINLNNN